MQSLFNIRMEHYKDVLLYVSAILLAWFSDVFYIIGVKALFVTFPDIREYLLDIKDIMSFIITALTLFLVFKKCRKELKNKKK